MNGEIEQVEVSIHEHPLFKTGIDSKIFWWICAESPWEIIRATGTILEGSGHIAKAHMSNMATCGANRQIRGTQHGHNGHLNRKSFCLLSDNVKRMGATKGDGNKKQNENGKKPEGWPQRFFLFHLNPSPTSFTAKS